MAPTGNQGEEGSDGSTGPPFLVLRSLADNDRVARLKRLEVEGCYVDIQEEFGCTAQSEEDEADGGVLYSVYSNTLWDGALLCATLFRRRPELVRGRRLLELGAGLGLPSIVAGALGARAVATEQLPLDLLSREVDRNAEVVRRNGGHVTVQELDWAWPPEKVAAAFGNFDVVIGCDILAGVKTGRRHFCQILGIISATLALCGEGLLTWIPRCSISVDRLMACVEEVMPGWTADFLDEAFFDPAFVADGAKLLRLRRPLEHFNLNALD